MAADLDTSSNVIPVMVSTRRLEGTLVAPVTVHKVPNHLTDTRIFGKANKNGMLQVNPSTILFDGYKVGKLHQRTLRIINSSTLNQQMHLIPPNTSFFRIKYSKKKSSLIPGLSLDVVIEFEPTEWRYYYDCVRIHCTGEQNILVPIHGYPVMNIAHFPRSVTFTPIPIGQTQTRMICLKSDIPVKFDYQLSFVKRHPAFTVKGMKGIVPANGETEITVIFAPTEFNTAVMELKLELSQYNFTPVVCTFTGTSAPGLALQQLKLPTELHQPLPALPTRMNLYCQINKEHKLQKRRKVTSSNKADKIPQEIVHRGVRFPKNFDTPGTIGKVLMQHPGKLNATQLKEATTSHGPAVSVAESVMGLDASRQVKEAAFIQAVRQASQEERANQLKWVTHLGGVPMTTEEMEAVYRERKRTQELYEDLWRVIPEKEYSRTCTVVKYQRTRRKAQKNPECPQPTFNLYLNNLWMRRHMALERFVQAGRKVIIRLRCQARLEKLKKLISDLKAGKSLQKPLVDTSEDRKVPSVVSILPSLPNHILRFSFPEYIGHSSSNTGPLEDHTGDQTVEVKPIYAANIKKEVPYLDLKVPQQSQVLGYSPVLIPGIGSYIPSGLPKHLIGGAEDEYESLGHIPGVDPSFLTPNAFYPTITSTTHRNITQIVPSPTSSQLSASSTASVPPTTHHLTSCQGGVTRVRSPTMILEDMESSEDFPLQVKEEKGKVEEVMVPISMPPSLLEPPDLHPLQILIPTADTTSFHPMLPHSEATFDHTLLLLPPYSTAKHPQVRLDPIDVIPGLMNWKNFPSPCLTAFESNKKLSSLWRPHFSDPFSSSMLPTCEDSPQLLSGIQSDDFVDADSTEVLLPVPSMDMIRTQFYIPDIEKQDKDSSNKDREEPSLIKQQASELFHEANEKLEKHRLNQFNQLGKRIKNRSQIFRSHFDNSVDENKAT